MLWWTTVVVSSRSTRYQLDALESIEKRGKNFISIDALVDSDDLTQKVLDRFQNFNHHYHEYYSIHKYYDTYEYFSILVIFITRKKYWSLRTIAILKAFILQGVWSLFHYRTRRTATRHQNIVDIPTILTKRFGKAFIERAAKAWNSPPVSVSW